MTTYKDGIYLVKRKSSIYKHTLQRHEGVWYYFWHKDGKPMMKVYTDENVTTSFNIIKKIDIEETEDDSPNTRN